MSAVMSAPCPRSGLEDQLGDRVDRQELVELGAQIGAFDRIESAIEGADLGSPLAAFADLRRGDLAQLGKAGIAEPSRHEGAVRQLAGEEMALVRMRHPPAGQCGAEAEAAGLLVL